MRVLELFCGLGGLAAALGERAEIVAAVDVSRPALDAYRLNFDHPVWPRSIESIGPGEIARLETDLWWLSPPCQPYTRRGRQRDLEDPRAAGLLHVIDRWLPAAPPPWLALENVVGFERSQAHRQLTDRLDALGYERWEQELCPTELGHPNRRPRYYLVAGRDRAPRPTEPPRGQAMADWTAWLDPDADERLDLPGSILEAYRGALHLVPPGAAPTNCFTRAYGRSWVRSGSYLDLGDRVRFFSPREVASLLGFPPAFRLPGGPPRCAWRLLGNSLSIPAVRHVLGGVA